MKRFCLFLFLSLVLADAALAGRARTVTHGGASYDVYEVSDVSRLRLFWRDPWNKDLLSFGRVKALAEAGGGTLSFAMNAGMFHPGHAPVGLFVSEGVMRTPVVLQGGRGNFFMRPNGVFYIYDAKAGILESVKFAKSGLRPRLATQSGPLMLMAGKMHPRFYQGSNFLNIRNGVGVRPNGEVVFAISRQPVNFYEFATLFRDVLGCPDALYLDGAISSAYIPAFGRCDLGGDFGPIIGETEAGSGGGAPGEKACRPAP